MVLHFNFCFKVFVALFSVLAFASAAPQYTPAPIYKPAPAPIVTVYKPAPAPVYAPAPAPAPAYAPVPVYADVPPAYDFAYAVNDHYHGVDFAANENRNG